MASLVFDKPVSNAEKAAQAAKSQAVRARKNANARQHGGFQKEAAVFASDREKTRGDKPVGKRRRANDRQEIEAQSSSEQKQVKGLGAAGKTASKKLRDVEDQLHPKDRSYSYYRG